MFQQESIEITKSGDADLGTAEGQRRARRGVEHSRRHDDPCAMLALDEDDISPTPLLGVESPDRTAVEGMPSIVDGHLRFDTGRITLRWFWAGSLGCSVGQTAAVIGRRRCTA